MAILGGFFEAKMINGVPDRVYSSIQYADRWARFIRDGISIEESTTLTNENQVTINNGTMTTQVALGKGYVQGYDYYMDAPVNVGHAAADLTHPRIDRVVIELNTEEATRAFVIKAIAGTPAAVPVAPALTRTATVWQLSLAQVRVPAGVVVLNTATITDERANDAVCGLANVLIGIKPPTGNDAETVTVADVNKIYAGPTVEDVLIELGASIQGAAAISTTITETSPTVTTIDTLASGVLFTRVTITETSSTVTTVNNKIYEPNGATIKHQYNDVITEVSATQTTIVRTVI